MTREQLIEIAEKLNKWLDEVSEEYKIDKITLQDIIKQFLILQMNLEFMFFLIHLKMIQII